jgi:hypothetical protein
MHTLLGQKRIETRPVFSDSVMAVGDMEIELHDYFISFVDGGEWSASHFCSSLSPVTVE